MSINIFDAYQHPGKWCEVVSPMCTPSNRLCETTATCWYLTSHEKHQLSIYRLSAGYNELEGITFLLVIVYDRCYNLQIQMDT